MNKFTWVGWAVGGRNHLRDFAFSLEKHKVVQNYPMEEDRNQVDCKFFSKSSPKIEIIVDF